MVSLPSLVQTVAADIYIYSLLRSLLGFFARPAFGTLYCIYLEKLSTSDRARFMPLVDMTSGFTSIYMALSGYIFDHWKNVSYFWGAQVAFCGLLCLFIPESEEWLKSQERKSTTKCSLLADICAFFRSRSFLSIWPRLAFVWSSVVLTFYGLNFNAENLAGEIYLNFVYFGLVDAAANVILVFVSPLIPRKWMATGLITVAGSFCLASGIAKSQDIDDNVVNALAYCGKFFISGAYSLVYLVTGELFPTSVRLVYHLNWSLFIILQIDWLFGV